MRPKYKPPPAWLSERAATFFLISGSPVAGLKRLQSLPATFSCSAVLCVSAAPLAGKRKLRASGLLLVGLLAATLLVTFGCGGVSSPAPLTVGSAQLMNSRFSVVATSGGIEHRGTIKLVVHLQPAAHECEAF